MRYFRHPENRGPTANFDAARRLASGDYFIWLADDDWLGPAYVRRCQEELAANPDHALVCGRVRYYKKGEFSFDGPQVNVLARAAGRRVLHYYRRVGDNGTFYGLLRRKQILNIPLVNVMGGDSISSPRSRSSARFARCRRSSSIATSPGMTPATHGWRTPWACRRPRPASRTWRPLSPRTATSAATIRCTNPSAAPRAGGWRAGPGGWFCRRNGLRLPRLLKVLWRERRAGA